jgi:hypothetical protein
MVGMKKGDFKFKPILVYHLEDSRALRARQRH